MSRRARVRRALVTLHLWLGLTVGAVWALQGLTGALLVFHRELDHAAVAGRGGVMAPLTRVVAVAQRAGAEDVRRIGVRDAIGDVLQVDYERAGEHRSLLVDAATARPLTDRAAEPRLPIGGAGWRWVYRLHEALLLGERGETLVGLSGLLLLSSALVGLWLGWPRRRPAIAFAVARWRSWPQRLYGWHRMVGLLATLGFAVTVPTGAWMIFAAELRPVVARLVPFALPPPLPPRRPGPRIDADTALAAARRVFPDAVFVRLTLPTAKADAWLVRVRRPGELRAWSGTSSVTVDAVGGRVLARYDAVTAPPANRAADAAFALHSGEAAGLAGRLAVVLLGLSLPLFYVTGVAAWLARRRRKSKPKMANPILTTLTSR